MPEEVVPCGFKVGLATTPPHPYKPLGIWAGPYLTIKKPFVSIVGAK